MHPPIHVKVHIDILYNVMIRQNVLERFNFQSRKIKKLEFEIDSYRKRSKPNLWRLWNTCVNVVNAMEQRRKLQKMCLTYRLCATLHCFTPSRFTNARPPTQTLHRLHGTMLVQTLSQPKGRWEVTMFLPPKKSTTFSLHTNTFHSNLDRIYTILHPSSQTHNYSIDSTTHIWGDPISIILFFSTDY